MNLVGLWTGPVTVNVTMKNPTLITGRMMRINKLRHGDYFRQCPVRLAFRMSSNSKPDGACESSRGQDPYHATILAEGGFR